jgi:hypothetical protein
VLDFYGCAVYHWRVRLGPFPGIHLGGRSQHPRIP